VAEIVWSDKAVTDLELIYDYIAADSPFYARVQIERIFKAIEQLKPFPGSGRNLPEFNSPPPDYSPVATTSAAFHQGNASPVIMVGLSLVTMPT
jgi:plasmid stabilization system protein ParE